LITFLKDIILKAGEICKKEQALLKPLDIEYKNKKDIVTTTDKKVENFIVEHIKKEYPSHDIFGEETGKTDYNSEYTWIIDPIDGTTSFLHQQPFYSVSIALQHKDEIILGAVYAPAFNELFYAEAESGAFLNESPIHVSGTDKLIHSVMATGFACLRADLKQNNLAVFCKIVPQLRDIRRYGSAALDLCYVACGRLDGFWEYNLNLYDIAAGAFIVKQAKGSVTDFTGASDFPKKGIAATNTLLHTQLLDNFKTE
jgi:myo-inositol-1(or 4)-monophosphatase